MTLEMSHLKTGTGYPCAKQVMTVISEDIDPLKCLGSFPALNFGCTPEIGSNSSK